MNELILTSDKIGAEYLRDESRSTGSAEYAVFAGNAEDVISLLSGIKCGFKSTSCPDQLAMAVKKAISQE